MGTGICEHGWLSFAGGDHFLHHEPWFLIPLCLALQHHGVASSLLFWCVRVSPACPHKAPVVLRLRKRFQGKVLASNSFQCWHFPCGSNCWTFSLSELSSARQRDGGHCVRWLEKRGAPRLVGLGKRFQGKVLASNSFQCWHFPCGSNCWTFSISELSSAIQRDGGHSVRWL